MGMNPVRPGVGVSAFETCTTASAWSVLLAKMTPVLNQEPTVEVIVRRI